MGYKQLFQKICALVAIIIVTSACSEVAFTPAPGNASFQNPVGEDGRVTESFLINEDRPLTKVDVLFVVDNSQSMSEEQARLGARLSSFVDTLVGVDWQIGITTTNVINSTTAGRLVQMTGTASQILTRSTANYEQVFLNTILANGTSPDCISDINLCPDGSGNEQPLRATQHAVSKRNTDNAGFFRSDADFVTITLSDEDEMSTGTDTLATTPQQLIDSVEFAFGANKNFTGYGIIIRPSDTNCYNQQTANGGNYGDFVQSLADLTMGVTGSICDDDYGPALSSIGQRVRRVPKTITLASLPATGTVQVQLVPADPNITWQVMGRDVVLSDLPSRGTRVNITYEPVP